MISPGIFFPALLDKGFYQIWKAAGFDLLCTTRKHTTRVFFNFIIFSSLLHLKPKQMTF